MTQSKKDFTMKSIPELKKIAESGSLSAAAAKYEMQRRSTKVTTSGLTTSPENKQKVGGLELILEKEKLI